MGEEVDQLEIKEAKTGGKRKRREHALLLFLSPDPSDSAMPFLPPRPNAHIFPGGRRSWHYVAAAARCLEKAIPQLFLSLETSCPCRIHFISVNSHQSWGRACLDFCRFQSGKATVM